MGLASDAVSATASLMGGFERRRAAKEQAMAAEYRAGISRLRSKQVAAEGARNLNDTIGAINAIRAARGLSQDSGTAQAIARGAREDNAAATNSAVLSELLDMDAERNKARSLKRSAGMYAFQGFAEAASTMSSSVKTFAKFMGG